MMKHRAECRKYLLWKKEQEKRSKKEEKKEKKPKVKNVLDCLDDDEDDNLPQSGKPGIRKCKKKKIRRRKPRNKVQYVVKEISIAELIMKRIKPAIETREILLNPRHVRCMWTTVPDSVLKIVESAMMLLKQKPPKRRKRRKVDAKKTKKDEEEEVADEGADGKSRDTIGTKKSKSSKPGATKQKSKRSRKRTEVVEDCDSLICLAGVKLTAEDRKKMKQYQREAEEANAEEKSNAAA